MSAGAKKLVIAVPSLTNGGAERSASLWASELLHRGFHVSLVLFHRSPTEYPVESTIPIHTILEGSSSLTPQDFPRARRELRSLLKRLEPDCVLSLLAPMQILMMLASRGLPIERIDFLLNNPQHGRVHENLLLRALWSRCFRRCDKIVVQMHDQLRFFASREQRKCFVVPNPLSPSFEAIETAAASDAATRFLAVGRLHPQKNLEMLVRAFALVAANHADVELLVYGKGDRENAAGLQALIEELGMHGRIRLMGWCDAMPERYQDADAFLLSSDYEGLPNALMEAMACGLPCIATDCETGPSALIENGESGFLVPVGDTQGFARTIEKLLALNAGERFAMGSVARNRMLEFFSLQSSTDALVACLEA